MSERVISSSGKAVRVVVIGGGAAGTLAVLKLARMPSIGSITMLDRDGTFGRGLAYSATQPWHRLNVPASKLGGVDGSDPTGFVSWLAANGHAPGSDFAKSFVPRRLYGDYLCAQLEPLLKTGAVEARHGEARKIEKTGAGYDVVVSDGDRIHADIVLLCLGNQPPADIPSIEPKTYFVRDVWAPGALARLEDARNVLVLGTGATAIDTVLDLHHRGMKQKITMVSRRGLLPLADVVAVRDEHPLDVGKYTSVLDLLRALRADAAAKAARGIPWQSVIDDFRLKLSGVWQRLPEAERARFLRHLKTMWTIHRHRLAPDVAQLLTQLQRHGHLKIIAGRLTQVEERSSGYEAALRKPSGEVVRVSDSWIVNCIGPEERYDRLDDPLVTSLLATGQARLGPASLGLDVDRECRLLDVDGAPQTGLYVIGAPTRGRFWEITSTPRIREQVAVVCAHLDTAIA